MGVQKVRWEKGRTTRAGNCTFSVGKQKKIINWEQFLVHYRILSAMKGLGIVTRIVLRVRWFNIVVLNVHATSEEKSDDSKTVFMSN